MLRNRCKTAFIVGGFIYQLNDVTVRGEQSLEAALMAGLASPAALPPQHQNGHEKTHWSSLTEANGHFRSHEGSLHFCGCRFAGDELVLLAGWRTAGRHWSGGFVWCVSSQWYASA